MRTKRRTEQEQYEIIMECRQSGLSDHQWCLEHDINPGTFYNQVRRFRKQACEFPAPAGKDRFQAIHQEVVKMEIIPDQSTDLYGQFNEQFRDIPVRQEFVDTLTEEQKTCSICGTKMVEIGHELIRSEVIFTPAKLERVEYIATTYGCPKCKETEEQQFMKNNGVPALLRGSCVSPSLAAHVICQKFMNAMPLYRQEKDCVN